MPFSRRASSLTRTASLVSGIFRAASSSIGTRPEEQESRPEEQRSRPEEQKSRCSAIRIGIAYDLKTDYPDLAPGSPRDDLLEEYDSTETVDAIAQALLDSGHVAIPLGGGRTFLHRLLANPVDLVFNIAEGRGTRSREAQVPAVCELLRIPCSHSDPLTLAISLDKAMTKRIAAGSGVPTPAFVCVGSMDELDAERLPAFPLFAKPAFEGSSIGIHRHSRCENLHDLWERVGFLLRHYRGAVLIEHFLPGIEIAVLVMGRGGGARVVGMMEISPRSASTAAFVYSLEVKRDYRNQVNYHVPPRLPDAAKSAVGETALRTYRAIGCRDIARLDIRLDETGIASLIEVNPLPGLHPVDGDVPILCNRLGIPYIQLIRGIVDEAVARL